MSSVGTTMPPSGAVVAGTRSPGVKETPMSDIRWLGNRVALQDIDGTDLTYLEWRRPWHGSLRGHLVVGSEERALLEGAVEDAEAGRREHPRLDAAGGPTDLEAFVTDVLGRRPGNPAPQVDATP
jgi:hypothetical protein